jgi:hypothetical protein
VFEWPRRGFGLVNRFIGSSLVVTTISSYTLKIAVVITHTSCLLFTSLVSILHYSFNCLELSWALRKSKSKSKSHCDWRSVSQSVSKSWCRAPSGAHDQIFINVWELRSSCFLWGALSDERTGLCFVYMLLVLASAVFLGSEFFGTRDRILLYQILTLHKVKVTLRLTESQSVSLGVKPNLGIMIIFITVWQLQSCYCEAPSLTEGSPQLSQSHIATDDQSISTSWYRASSGTHDQIFITL